MSSSDDSSDEPVVKYVDPSVEMNLGLWFLFAGATIFLALRIFFKFARRHHLWWDDYILLLCWVSQMLALASNLDCSGVETKRCSFPVQSTAALTLYRHFYSRTTVL